MDITVKASTLPKLYSSATITQGNASLTGPLVCSGLLVKSLAIIVDGTAVVFWKSTTGWDRAMDSVEFHP